MELGLAGRIAVVTGAATGIGLACAKQLAAEGATVIMVDRDAGRLEAETAAMNEAGRALPMVVDVSDRETLTGCIQGIANRHGRLDILVNNAAVAHFVPIEDLSDDAWDEMFATNAGAVRSSTRAVLPIMRRQGSGSIINISSIAGARAQFGSSAYGASKAAIKQFTDVTAVEAGQFGIRANTVQLGAVRTEGTDKFGQAFPEEYAMVAKFTPLRRWAEVHEVAAVVTFLASDQASFVTGACIMVDGGLGVSYPC